MLPDHAARILARSAGLGTEAGCAGGVPQRQRGLVKDGFADEIGERNFGSWDEPERNLYIYKLIGITFVKFQSQVFLDGSKCELLELSSDILRTNWTSA
jgi:hypothetical protein